MTNERLRSAIHSAGLSIELLSDRAGVDPKTVERWITKDRVPHRAHRDVLTRLLGKPEAFLWPSTESEARTQSASAAEFRDGSTARLFAHETLGSATRYGEIGVTEENKEPEKRVPKTVEESNVVNLSPEQTNAITESLPALEEQAAFVEATLRPKSEGPLGPLGKPATVAHNLVLDFETLTREQIARLFDTADRDSTRGAVATVFWKDESHVRVNEPAKTGDKIRSIEQVEQINFIALYASYEDDSTL